MSIRFPDFSVLFHRSTQTGSVRQQAGVVPTPELMHAQAAGIQQENQRRRTRVSRGDEVAGKTVDARRRESRRGGKKDAPRTLSRGGVGRRLDIEV
ncbi:MAG TPA: hypothetical protein VK101_01530 [Limnochordia bacterium]|nr:hypothetical protein [Limnochordia bacterium]